MSTTEPQKSETQRYKCAVSPAKRRVYFLTSQNTVVEYIPAARSRTKWRFHSKISGIAWEKVGKNRRGRREVRDKANTGGGMEGKEN